MKKCFSTLSTFDLSMEEVISLAMRNGIEGIEIRMADFNTVFGKEINRSDEVKAAFKKANIKIVDLAPSLFIREYNVETVENGKKSIDFANALGATGIRIFLTYSESGKDFEGIVKSLCELAEYAEPKGVELWLETHSEFSTGESLNEVLSACNKSNIKVIWDLIHTVEFGESPMRTVEILKDKIIHIHIKDGKYCKETAPHYKQTALSGGTVNVKEMYEALEKINYNGYFSLEWEEKWHPELKTCYSSPDELMKAFIKFLA